MMEFFLFTTMSKLALGTIHPPIQCIPGALTLGVKQLKLTTHLHLVPKLRMHSPMT